MRAMESSSIAAAGYDGEEQVLRVRYIGGGTYDYLEVPEEVYDALLQSSSKGQFVNCEIKPAYPYRRVD
jgi:hypothetical protein